MRTSHPNYRYGTPEDNGDPPPVSPVQHHLPHPTLDDEGDVQPQPVAPPPQAPPRSQRVYHPYLTALPCDEHGNFLPPGSEPSARTDKEQGNWTPFDSRVQFRTADLLYRRAEMAADILNELMELWDESLSAHDDSAPFNNVDHMHKIIDSAAFGDAPWQCYTTSFPGDIPADAPSWKHQKFEIWCRNAKTVASIMLDNPNFDGQFDTCPYVELDAKGKRRWSNMMSANLAWRHCDDIYAADPETEGAMYCPIIAGSDKTTVSVSTGQVEYHPLYLSIGTPENTIRRAHRNTIVPIGFLAIPKGDCKFDKDPEFRKFKRQLYHSSISAILQPLRAGMLKPVIRRCPDGHFRRVIYDLAAFIADYPEQVTLAGIVQGWCCRCTAHRQNLNEPTNRRSHEFTDNLIDILASGPLWDTYGIDDDIVPFTYDFPRADIHEMLSPNLLHQIIKGTFKDHLVTWVGEYLILEHGEARANDILDDIDHRIAATPAFPGLRHFHDGRCFKQWTGDDSKALMKVYLPAIVGYVPEEMVQCLAAFLDFCYIARQQDINEDALVRLKDAIQQFHELREIFWTTGVRPTGFSLPRQHAIFHYPDDIMDFGALGGVCSSITESRHITAVKRPWRRSNWYEALGQMLLTNQRLDKLAAMHVDFTARRMLPTGHVPPAGTVNMDNDEEVDDGGPVDDEWVRSDVTMARTRIRNYPRNIKDLAMYINEPLLPSLARHFLYDQLHPDSLLTSNDIPLRECPTITSKISVFHSAVAMFSAPSDSSGVRGMRRKRIRSTPSWRGKGVRRDCVFAIGDKDKVGMEGMTVLRVRLFFSFHYGNETYPCALVEWFKRVGRSPDPVTGMWKVQPDEGRTGQGEISVLHLDSFVRGTHLIPVYGNAPIPIGFHHTYSLDAFRAFYVDKYIDHQSYEIAF